jgi:peptidoglycan/LPS O-acetylase OafA/YrhL
MTHTNNPEKTLSPTSDASVPLTNAGWQSLRIDQNNLDFCRFWLAVMVIFSHSYQISQGNEDAEPMGLLTNGQLRSGPFAVCCFFAISGFLITHSWIRSKSSADFLMKRFLRIYPGFIAVTLLGVFLLAPLVSDHFEFGSRKLLTLSWWLVSLRQVPVPSVFPNNPLAGVLNGSLWSIPYEFKCYLAVMLIGSLGFFRQRTWMTFLLVGVVIGSALYPSFVSIPWLEQGPVEKIFGSVLAWCEVFPYFIAGMAFYLFRDRIPSSTFLLVIAIVLFAAASAFPPAGLVVFPFAITYALFWFAYHPQLPFKSWSRYGDFSYGTYLYAFPIQQLITMKMPGISPMTLFLISTPLSVIAGVFSWHLVEKHFLRLKNRLQKRPLTEAQGPAAQGPAAQGPAAQGPAAQGPAAQGPAAAVGG